MDLLSAKQISRAIGVVFSFACKLAYIVHSVYISNIRLLLEISLMYISDFSIQFFRRNKNEVQVVREKEYPAILQ